jgi:hypothetical protein
MDRNILDDCCSCTPPKEIRDQECGRDLVDRCYCESTVSFRYRIIHYMDKLTDRATSSLTYGVSKVSSAIPE